jgi:hypothetical protein
MSSAFERLQKLAAEKQLKERAEKPRLEIVPVNNDARPSAPSAVSASNSKIPVAPEKDFAKVANSIVRQLPNGLFIGKSKQMYDYLYSLTRGAIKPTRSIRLTKSILMRGSGIRSTHTFYNNLRHLETIGLLIATRIDGEKEGNSYEVFLPEESKKYREQSMHPEHSEHLAQSVQKLHGPVSAVSALTALGSNPINIGTSSIPKTSFKDKNTNDDDLARDAREAFDAFIEKFQTATEEITGKKLSKKKDGEHLEKIADLLILELKIAAARTERISSVSAFLVEILRRNLRDSTSKIKTSDVKVTTIGKSEQSGYEIKPLDAKGREEALTQLREFADDDFLQDFSKWYTSEDWTWLGKQLKKESKKN